MGIVIRQSIKSSIISYLGVVIGTVNLLWLSITFLQPDQLALSRVLVEASLLFASFSQLGTTQISDRFFPHFKDDTKKHHGFFTFLLIYPLAGFFTFCLALLIFKGALVGFYVKKAPLLNDFIYFIIPLTFFVMYQSILESYSRIHLRIVVPTIVRELFLKLSNSLIIILFALHLIDFDTFVILTVGSYGLAVILLLFYVKWLGKLYFQADLARWNFPLFRQVVYFGLFIIMGSLGVLLTTKIDVLMLPALSGLDSTGIYVVATFMAGVIEIPKRSISQISAPLISQAIKMEALDKVLVLYKKTSIHQLLAGIFIFLGIWCNIDAVFALIPKGEIYQQGKYVVALLGLSKLIDMATGANAEIIMYSRYYKFTMVTMLLLAFITIVTNFIFIPIYGINGAAFAAALSIFVFTVIKCWFVWIKFRMHPFTIQTFYALLIALAVYFAASLIPSANGNALSLFINITLRSLLITVLFAGLTVWFHISEEVNTLVALLYKRLLSAVR
ncbi:MAG: polysaccharide biosynthesis C-terminal domain-containing protein [Bacteroidota bacterium]